MGGELDIAVGPDTTSIIGRRPGRSRRRRGAADRRRRAAPAAARIRARAAEGRPAAQPRRSSAARRRRSRRRSSPSWSTATIRTAGSSRRKPSSRPTRSIRSAASTRVTSRRVVRGCTSLASSTPPAMEAAIRQAFEQVGKGSVGRRRQGSAAGLDRASRCSIGPSAPQSTLCAWPARAQPVPQGLGAAAGHGRAPRRRVRVAHHLEHPRAEGLHLLARQHGSGASGPGALGRDRRRHDERDRRVAQGDLFRDRPAAERAAAGGGAARASRTTSPGIFVVQNASRGGVIGRLAFVDLHGLGDEYLSTYVKRVMAVTPEDVRRIAERVPDARQHDAGRRR